MGLFGDFFVFLFWRSPGGRGCGQRLRPPLFAHRCHESRHGPGAGRSQIAGDFGDPGGTKAMFPCIAIGPWRTAAFAAVHTAALTVADGGRSARRLRTRKRAATGGVCEDIGLHVQSIRGDKTLTENRLNSKNKKGTSYRGMSGITGRHRYGAKVSRLSTEGFKDQPQQSRPSAKSARVGFGGRFTPQKAFSAHPQEQIYPGWSHHR